MNAKPSIKTLLASFFTFVERETWDALRNDERRHRVRVLPGFLTLKVAIGKDEAYITLLPDLPHEGMKLVIIVEKDGSQPVRRTISLDSSPADIAKYLIVAL